MSDRNDANRDPITNEPGAHPVGTGLGAAVGGAAAGAATGAFGGPVGAAIGGVVGAVAGGLAGKAAPRPSTLPQRRLTGARRIATNPTSRQSEATMTTTLPMRSAGSQWACTKGLLKP